MKKLLYTLLTVSIIFAACEKEEEVLGCTNESATNYNSSATNDDGSCIGACIGCLHQGGIVFYLDGNGGGLIAAPTDQPPLAVNNPIPTGNSPCCGDCPGLEWGCYGTAIPGADGTAIGTGNQNTIDIEAGCTTPGTAADICANLTLGGYSDWFLPSKDELNEMYKLHNIHGLGGFANAKYWSSTKYNEYYAWYQGFYPTPNQFHDYANYCLWYVRAVRAF